MHCCLIARADVFAGQIEFSDADELEQIGEAINANETVRWPTCRVATSRRSDPLSFPFDQLAKLIVGNRHRVGHLSLYANRAGASAISNS